MMMLGYDDRHVCIHRKVEEMEEINPCEVKGTERVDCGETEKQACLDKHCCFDDSASSGPSCFKYKGTL